MTEDEDIAHWDGAYVLGALSPQERLEYENYLAANPERVAALTDSPICQAFSTHSARKKPWHWMRRPTTTSSQ